jgi:SAM-dependent methyltransferase
MSSIQEGWDIALHDVSPARRGGAVASNRAASALRHGQSAASVPDARLSVLEDFPFLIDRVATITGSPTHEVRERLVAEMRSPGTNVRRALAEADLPPHEWSDRLVAFYAQTDAFLYETLTWNLCSNKRLMRRWIAEFLRRHYPRGARILCYGDGLGCDSTYLAQAGHDVTYFEVSERCRKFASSLFERSGVHVEWSGSLASLESGSFDVVVCLDVLEHVPDPLELVGDLTRLIRLGGHFLVHAPFFYLSPNVGTHLGANRRYSGDWKSLYAPHGLHPVDAQIVWAPLALQRMGAAAPRTPIPFNVRFGGWLLGVARHWHAPHVLLCEKLVGLADRRALLRRAELLAGKTI